MFPTVVVAVTAIFSLIPNLAQSFQTASLYPVRILCHQSRAHTNTIAINKKILQKRIQCRATDIGSFASSSSEHQEIPNSYTLKQRNPYDVHVYYNGEEEREEAMKLREKMQQKFGWMRFYAPKDRPIGPHPVPMWEADFRQYDNRQMWSDVKDFVEQEHGDLSVLIHPHSMDGDYADHTKNAFWAGKILDLRIESWKRY